MLCTECDGATKVVDSRPAGNFRIRERRCKECGHRFVTVEMTKELAERIFNLKKE